MYSRYSMHVICSETCPYNEYPGHPKVCNCDQGCSVNDKCELLHHAEKEGAFKKVIFGIIGPDDYVDEVHREMKRLKYNGGVYTLMISEFINKRAQKPRNTTEDVMREVETLEQIKKIDPSGEFTPTILFSKRLDREGRDFQSLQRINANILRSKKINKKTFIGYHIQDITASNSGDIFFLYVTDAGETLESLIDLIGTGVSKRRSAETQMKEKSILESITVNSVRHAIHELEQNYNKLASNKIGHCDLHWENITYRVKDGKLGFNIIDFGFHNHKRYGQERNILHFLTSFIVFGNRAEVYRCMRSCDPVHYYMFVMCFEIMYECISLRDASQKTESALYDLLITMMSKRLFVDSVTREQDMCHMMGLLPGTTGPPSRMNKKYMDFLAVMTDRYDGFYDMHDLRDIWQRVCEKMYDAVVRFTTNVDVNFLDHIRPDAKRLPCNKFKDVYIESIKQNIEVYYVEAYPVIFDDFCMAYYDKTGPFDKDFLISKFDKFSIAHNMVKLLHCVEKKLNSFQLQLEIDEITASFKLKNIVLPPQQLSIEQTMSFLLDDEDEHARIGT
jgi:hypothetical protein